MTPTNRKNNKRYPPETRITDSGIGMGAIKNNTSNSYTATPTLIRSHPRYDQSQMSRSRSLQMYDPHPSNANIAQSLNHQTQKSRIGTPTRSESEFIPQFALADACRENNDRKIREVCRKLLTIGKEEAQPVVNFQDQTGRTALSYGCGCGNTNIIDEISRLKCADPNIVDNDGNAPLHYSSVCGHSEGVDLLLTRFHGVIDVNVRNASGLTPLMKAALQGRTRVAKSLLAAGASPFLKDYIRGLSAAEWAQLCGRHMCAEIINRSAVSEHPQEYTCSSTGSSMVFSRTYPNFQISEEHCRSLANEQTPYYHFYARSTVNGAKWLKNKIKKALGGVRSEDKSFVCDNPAVRSLADRRPTVPDKNYSVLSNLSLGGAAICASSLLMPEIQPYVDKRRPKPTKKLPIPLVHITPVRR